MANVTSVTTRVVSIRSLSDEEIAVIKSALAFFRDGPATAADVAIASALLKSISDAGA